MFKANRFLAIIVLFLFVGSMGSCGGGGGGSGGGTPPSTSSDGLQHGDGTTQINEDEVHAIFGSSDYKSLDAPIVLGINSVNTVSPKFQTNLLQKQDITYGVPWVSQVPPCNWAETANCGPTSFLMSKELYKNGSLTEDDIREVDALMYTKIFSSTYHGKYTPIGSMKADDLYCGKFMNEFINEKGVWDYWGASIGNLVQLARLYDLNAEDAEIISTDRNRARNVLIENLERGYPVIVRALYQGSTSSQPCNDSDIMRTTSGGHFMTVVGVEPAKDGKPEYVYVNDPATGSNCNVSYEYKKYTMASFLDVWGAKEIKGQKYFLYVLVTPQGNPLPIAIDSSSAKFPDGKIGTPYSKSLNALYGLEGYKWSAIGILPDGLILKDDGVIIGTPTRVGTFSFQLRVYDSKSNYAETEASINITSAAPPPLNIDTPPILISGKVNEQYRFSLSASGGIWPYNWSLASGNLPVGLGLATNGVIAGTPSTSGTYKFKVQLTDSNQQFVQKEFTIEIISPVPINNPPSVFITSPANGSTYTQGQSITFTGSATDSEDGTLSGNSLVWTSILDGQIGTGTSFTKNDLSVGTHSIILIATDSGGKVRSNSIIITITTSPTSLSITTTSLPSGTVGVSYGTNLSASGGKTPYTWSIISGSLPPSLSLSGAVGFDEIRNNW